MVYKRRDMQRIDAGMAMPAPKMIFEAISHQYLSDREGRDCHSLISHQIGAGLPTLPAQMRELINRMRQPVPVQAMYAQVPEFHAWRCQGRGTKETTNPRNDKIGKRGNVGSLLESMVSAKASISQFKGG